MNKVRLLKAIGIVALGCAMASIVISVQIGVQWAAALAFGVVVFVIFTCAVAMVYEWLTLMEESE